MQKLTGSKTLVPLLAGAAGLLISAGAAAQSTGVVSLERQTDEAFRQVLQQPQNLSHWSRYAQLLVEAGNYEGGIAALERLLLQPNASPDLRVDIAVLYYRLGSYDMAGSMLDTALADSRLQGDKRALAESLRADTQKRAQRSQLQGALMLGVRHQTNPTYRSDAAQVLSGGVLGPLADSQRPQGDTDINLGLRINHVYDLERQNSAAIVTNVGAYLVDYRSASGSHLVVGDSKPFDLQLLDLNTGLQFRPLPASGSSLTLRPHVIFSNLVARNHQYLRNYGLGLDMSLRPNERTLYEFTLDGVRRDFAQRADVLNANEQDGHLYSLRARVSRELAPGRVIVGEYTLRRATAERNIYAADSHEIRATYLITYASPLALGGHWTTALWMGALNRSYDAPDPAVGSTVHKDREWRVGVNQTIPLAPLWSVLLSAEYARNQANLPNYRYKNTSVSATVVRSF
jgi:hypothetical protein